MNKNEIGRMAMTISRALRDLGAVAILVTAICAPAQVSADMCVVQASCKCAMR